MKEENNQTEKYVVSSDGMKIYYEETGKGNIAILFVHGWLGNVNWWNNQQVYFRDKYNIVQIDLGGHGKSDKTRQNWTGEQYADDIKAVIGQIRSPEIILVGHSMSGAYVLEAAINSPKINAVILVDTLKDLDEVITYEEAEQSILTHYRNDFKATVENILPQYLFAETTPISVKQRLQNEFLQNESDLAIKAIEPLYKIDIRKAAKSIQVPVRAINSDATPTNVENNRKYLKDYDYTIITGTGHYPMLEKPDEFNSILENLINGLTQ